MKRRRSTQGGFAHVFFMAIALVVGAATVTGVYVVKVHNTNVNKRQLIQQKRSTVKQQETARVTIPPKASNQGTAPHTPPSSTPCAPNTTMYVTSSVGLYLRGDTTFSSSPVVLMPYASALQVGCLAKGWYKAIYSGKTGYVSRVYLSSSKPRITSNNTSSTSPSPSPSPSPSVPTTVTIGNATYKCSPSPSDPHWQSLVYAYKNPTYSYKSPNGATLNSYVQWSNITGLSCASTGGWLVRNSEYFWGGDLVVS